MILSLAQSQIGIGQVFKKRFYKPSLYVFVLIYFYTIKFKMRN